MNNAEKFQEVFGYYATEMWAKPETEFLEWINSEYRLREQSIEVSEDCISREYLLSKVYDMDNDDLVVDYKDIVNAPSVVPTVRKNRTVEQSSMVGECPYFIDGVWCNLVGKEMKGEKNEQTLWNI